MSDAPSAYRIEAAVAVWQSMRARLLDEDPSRNEDELTELLGPEEGDIDEILSRVLRASVHARDMKEAADKRAKIISERKTRFERREDALRGTAFAILDALGKTKHEMPDLTASITSGKQVARITDDTKIPDVYVEIVTIRKPDRAVILADLKAGREIGGCELGNGAPSLTIRTR